MSRLNSGARPLIPVLILIVEDEKLIRWSLRERLEKEGYEVHEAATGEEGLRKLGEGEFDLVLLDYRLPDRDGLELMKDISKDYPDTLAIMMTAYSTVDSAVEAMKLGAFDYIAKPFNMDELVLTISKALETTNLRREIKTLRQQQKEKFGSKQIIGSSPQMIEVFNLIERVAQSDATTVLLEGESGTGKDLVAKVIHHKSRRGVKPFMTITCSALPENLLESELFGHEKGAFTDAKAQKIGLLELADNGTVFMDEIGDLPLSLQAKLLRFMEEKAFRRVGGVRDYVVDVRIVAATNKDLGTEVGAGRFRSDLYYRMKVIPIKLPPLRDRKEDIPPLVKLFIDGFNRELRKNVRVVSKEAMDHLIHYHWPGNVRELRNIIERAILLGGGEEIAVDDLPVELREEREVGGGKGKLYLNLTKEGIDFSQLERELVEQALRLEGGNQTKAARLLGMNRDQIRYRIEKFGIKD
ncbi:MAG: Fis family transcriptional regulator [Candidatus Glassbacteria bacterium RBG_16_58_8]|uniref:Fis family transcriptional regulator n=1 Tax=Candidatus Glassbacteria bacterium RBG_16_58_8 TaxID=1817866 RepID=A0A1F5YCS1_9BACT|nr:MAG: Fis family transcriptional regulator [Candidatus Glassbacteria bacterium RBG_16_58_8]